MDLANIAARSGIAPTTTQFIRWQTQDFTLCWTTGGFGDWDGGNDEGVWERFTQRQGDYGTVGELPPFEDGIDGQNSRMDLTIYPDSEAALAAMADRKHQATPIMVWEVDIDPLSGQLIGTPDLLFRGEVDFPRLTIGDSWELILECGTEEARNNEPHDERRLTHAFHQSVWPGELGCAYVNQLGRKIYWRADQPSGISSGGSYTGNGGFGGGTGGDRL